MCGRFTLTAPAGQLQTRFAFTIPGPPPAPRYNIAPAQPVLAVLPGRDGRRTGAMLRWGLIPPWANDARIGRRMINAVSETAPDKPAFRDAFRRRRCLVPADGFYEWQRRGQQRIPLYFRQKSGQPMAFAGLWESWQPPHGEPILSCAILTTPANSLMAPVHHRMPAILSPEAEALWLDPLTQSPAALTPLLIPAPPESLCAQEVSPQVNNVRHDSPACIAPAHPAPDDAAPREVRLFN